MDLHVCEMNFSERPCTQDTAITMQALSVSQVTSVLLALLGEFSSPTAINLKGFSLLKQHKNNSIRKNPRPQLSLSRGKTSFIPFCCCAAPVTTMAIELKATDITGVLKPSIRKLCWSSPLSSGDPLQHVRNHCEEENRASHRCRTKRGHLALLMYFNHFNSQK